MYQLAAPRLMTTFTPAPHLSLSIHNEQQLVSHTSSGPSTLQPFQGTALHGVLYKTWRIIQQHLRRA
jgi:hypothetical protein